MDGMIKAFTFYLAPTPEQAIAFQQFSGIM